MRARPPQRSLYQALEERGGRCAVRDLLDATGGGSGPLRSLQAAGLVSIADVEAPRDPFAGPVTPAGPVRLTPDQARALESLAALSPGDRRCSSA